MKKKTRLAALLLCLALLAALTSGCAQTPAQESQPPASESPAAESPEAPPEEQPQEEPEQPEQPEQPEEPEEQLPEKYQVALPLVEEPMDISMYLLIPPFITSMLDSINDLSVVGALSERTGLSFDIVAGNYIDGASVLNIMIASGEYPDIINHIDLYSMGAEAAVEEEIVIDLYDYVVNDMPNLYSTLLGYDNALKQLTTADGYIAYFPQVHKQPIVDNFCFALRTDLMEGLGFQTPETFDQLHEVVAAINETQGLQIGLNKTGMDQSLMTGFNLTPNYRVVDGQVEYSLVADEMYDYLETVRQWYSEGLILTDFISYENHHQAEMLSSGRIAGTGGANASTINEADVRGEGIVVSAIPFVTPNAGDEIRVFGQGKVIRCPAWSISTQCDEEKIPVICQMVEYLFSDEGVLLMNYGVEGEGYTLDESGQPQWAELVTGSASGFVTASFLYATGNPSEYICGVFDDEKFYFNYNDRMFDAVDIISHTGTGEYDYPYGADGMISVDDRTLAAGIANDLETYIDESVLGWIMGESELTPEAFDAYVEHCMSMNLQTLIDIYQDAYDRFLVK